MLLLDIKLFRKKIQSFQKQKKKKKKKIGLGFVDSLAFFESFD
jgi:hypothetical protein